MSASFPYIHKTKLGARALRLSIAATGTITITTPYLTPKFVVERFIEQHSNWITEQLEKRARKPLFESEIHTTIFGVRYNKSVECHSNLPKGVHIIADKLVYNPAIQPDMSTPEKQEKWQTVLQKQTLLFLKKTAEHYIVNKTQEFATTMSVTFNEITLKQQKTRWGSCSSQKNLNFNWRLIHFPVEVINYVIVHELAHLTHMNHSAHFWQRVAQFDPEYLLHRGWLKRNGLVVE